MLSKDVVALYLKQLSSILTNATPGSTMDGN